MPEVIDARVGGAYASQLDSMNKLYVQRLRIDCSEADANVPGKIGTVGSGDTVQVFNIPAGFEVPSNSLRVVTPEGGTLTVDGGLYTAAGVAIDADGLLDGVDCNATADTCYSNRQVTLEEAAPPVPHPAYFAGAPASAVDRIFALLFNNEADAAVLDVSLSMVKVFDIEED
ncbi:MAG: hypothetical protein AMXMBFR84_26070 [Candidatus Hydrogenedentota bacterium]